MTAPLYAMIASVIGILSACASRDWYAAWWAFYALCIAACWLLDSACTREHLKREL